MTIRQPRFPLEPLKAYLLSINGGRAEGSPSVQASLRCVAERTGRTVNALHVAWYRWQREGVPLYAADELACSIAKLHPALVWGEEWWDKNAAWDTVQARREESHDHHA